MTTTLERRTKLFSFTPRSIDEENKTVRFCISDDSIDRYGEKVAQDWDLKNFLKNPIMLWNHKNGWDIEPEHVLGTWSDFETEGGKTYASAKFDDDINPKADTVFKQIIRGTLRCVSVGFIPHSYEMEEDVPVLKDNELLEISIVPIPANANAVALAFKEGTLNRNDAKWMLKSMQEGAAALEQQLKEAPATGKDDNMEELKAQLDTAVKSIEALTEGLKTVTDSLTTVTTELGEVKSAVAELKPTDPEPGDPGTPNPDEPAKGGDNDQPGAGADEIDEDAELTPELQAQIDAEFDAQEAPQDQPTE